MAVDRISVGGQPVRYIELGPARARLSTNQYGSMGGPIHDAPRFKSYAHPTRIVGLSEPPPRCHQRFANDTLVCGRPRHDILSPHRSVQNVERDRLKRKAPPR